MNNSIFVDSSLLIEYRKSNQTDFLDELLGESGIRLFISQTVVSEYLFYHLAIFGKKSPRTLKENGAISAIVKANDPRLFLNLFEWLPDNASMLQPAVELMSKYNLPPTTPFSSPPAKRMAFRPSPVSTPISLPLVGAKASTCFERRPISNVLRNLWGSRPAPVRGSLQGITSRLLVL